ncbi:fructose bisphosphate aldolase [Aurantiacibacter poecillastricola]|uniref:fructose bisphosphate aldolase n=1 Tax=Aurantiacibacter poecillastricola TaxID=3064385 RepID=UPI00273D4FAA|nr:fructose bisphosphate aldolase [Aurantiacibacter sp. 219JJ12-13]MDP5261875.1 fructose bisphosphate aldolase [Aurantiacibacter sp. 219JJ12-13]
MNKQEMTAKIAEGNGFIAALDQSGGSTPKALRGYGVDDSEWNGEDEMFARIHEMRARVITSPSFAKGKVIGAILFEKTMDGEVEGKPTAEALKDRGVVPFIKIDQGLADEENGVQLMKPLTRLDALLEKSVKHGMFGTKERSVIKSANQQGIAAIVAQQFEVGNRVIDVGLMPILEPEYDIKAADRAEGEEMLKTEILKNLDALADDRQVMLKLSIPVKANLYRELIEHPRVLAVVALSGGYTTEEACAELAKNKGMIASFSRAMLQDLRADQSDEEFDAALGKAINSICAASVA